MSLSQVRPRGRTIPAQWMNKPPITLNVPLVAFIQANGSSNWPDQSYLFHIQTLDYSSALYPRQQEVLRPIKSCESCNRDLAGRVTMVRFSIYRSISLWVIPLRRLTTRLWISLYLMFVLKIVFCAVLLLRNWRTVSRIKQHSLLSPSILLFYSIWQINTPV